MSAPATERRIMAIPFGNEDARYCTRISAMKALAFLAALLIAAQPAGAQGTYVSASLTGEVIRLDRVETAGRDQSNSGETLGFALRIGTELAARWGVELEFLRPAQIETEFSPGIVPLAFESDGLTFTELTNVPSTGATSVVFPSYTYRFRTRQRNTSLSSALWARQQISSGVSLVYLGGVGFHHRTEEATISFTPSPLPALPGIPSIPIVLPPSVSTATTYDVGPFAGIEARIGLTTHVQLVPGVRLHGIAGGWLLRPSVGLGWGF